MEKLNLHQILKETSESVSNGHSIEKLEEWKTLLKKLDREEKEDLKYAINILEIVIKLKKKKGNNIFKTFYLSLLLICLLALVSGSINYRINGETYMTIDENFTHFSNNMQISEGINFINKTNGISNTIYNAKFGEEWSNVPEAFENTLILETNVKNQYAMERCAWDNDAQIMLDCLNAGAPNRARTIRRSIQIIGNTTIKENDENFTLCEGYNYIDCNTDTTGADLGVQDDIEADEIFATQGLFSGGYLNVTGNINTAGNITAVMGIFNNLIANTNYINQLFATQISATTIYADSISATNMTMTRITHMMGSYSNNEAYVCVNNDGTIYAKDSECS